MGSVPFQVIFLYVLEGNARDELARIDEVAAGIGEPWVQCQCFLYASMAPVRSP